MTSYNDPRERAPGADYPEHEEHFDEGESPADHANTGGAAAAGAITGGVVGMTGGPLGVAAGAAAGAAMGAIMERVMHGDEGHDHIPGDEDHWSGDHEHRGDNDGHD